MASPAKRARLSGGRPERGSPACALGPSCGRRTASRPPRVSSSRAARPAGSGEHNPDPVAAFLSWCGRVGLELSPKVSVRREAGGGRRAAGAFSDLPLP